MSWAQVADDGLFVALVLGVLYIWGRFFRR